MPESSVLTLRLNARLRKKLDRLAEATNRSKSFLASEAIRDYVALNEWQINEIKAGIEEADRGEFATEEEVERVLNKWTRVVAARRKSAPRKRAR
jgi:predicted transcriptional regulator